MKQENAHQEAKRNQLIINNIMRFTYPRAQRQPKFHIRSSACNNSGYTKDTICFKEFIDSFRNAFPSIAVRNNSVTD